MVGTPAYLAPEQLRGMPLDARVDIHAMGVVLFEMLTGARPWKSETASVYAEILEHRPPPIHLLSAQIPQGLSEIVARALAKDPAARFARASDMRVSLEPFVGASGANVSAPTYLGGLGAETGAWRPAQHSSSPPQTLGTSTFGRPPTVPPQGMPPTVGMLPRTVGMVPRTIDSAPMLAPTQAMGSGGYPAGMWARPAADGVGPYASLIFIGLVTIGAVTLDRLSRRREAT